MFPNLLQPSGRENSRQSQPPFIHHVAVKEKRIRNIRVERLIVAGWVLIAIKSVVVWWACQHYTVPVHPLWVIVPTVLMALLCTGLYYYHRR